MKIIKTKYVQKPLKVRMAPILADAIKKAGLSVGRAGSRTRKSA
jgi:hypothetical protein